MNIAIIDDQQLFAEALADLLAGNDIIQEVKTYKSTQIFLAEQDSGAPDVIITNLNMIEINNIDFLFEIKKKTPSAKVIILSQDQKVNTIRYMINKGVNGYLSNDISFAELIAAIVAVQHDDLYVGESLRKSLMQDRQEVEQRNPRLTVREKEVLQFVCSGKTIKEASVEMRLSVHTVQTYYKNILKKFNLNRTADLIVYAIKNRIYDPESSNFL